MKKSTWYWRVLMVGGMALALALPPVFIDLSYADESNTVSEISLGTDLTVINEVGSASELSETVVTLDVASAAAAAGEDFDEDPWEPFNERMFWFNKDILDRFLLKPIATGWDFILPDPIQRGFRNFFDNLAVVRRVVNNGLQGKPAGAATELARFTINSTIGIAGFFDVAKEGFGIEQRDEDAGQTFGVWGAGPGPYLILPLLPPLTVR
ncbi:MAG TPA: VacJ family lipoprotein, partial [Candidatus Limnocylindria bacterium]|nr:VacJ family lipoprotein [Candidatus Limnocylindria bacterium]